MATNNFRFKVTTTDLDGNNTSETVSVNIGPSECTPPTVEFNFPSGVRVEVGDSTDPFWGAATELASVFCKVFPTARPSEGGSGDFLVQAYAQESSHPNSPDTRFEQTFEGAGGQLDASLTAATTAFMTVTSGTGISNSGLCQASDLVGLRKAIHLTNDATIINQGTQTSRFGRVVRVPGRKQTIAATDEGIAAYTHDLATDRVYTLQRGPRALGRPTKIWEAGTSVLFHPYHYTPMYSNTTEADVLVIPHIMVQEIGTQYPLTGRFAVNSTSVTGEFSDLLNEISGGGTGSYHVSGATNVIKFEDAEPWYVISGVLSSSGLVIYDYGDSPSLTNQAAQVNCYTLGSGTVAIQPDVAGCGWDVSITPQHETGDSVSSLSVDYTANVLQTKNSTISGTPSYQWEVDISGTVGGSKQPVWSGLVPGNLSTQTVVYERDVAKRIRVSVSGTGVPNCVKQYDTGSVTLTDAISAGTWVSIQSTATGAGGQIESKIRAELQGSRVADKYYHHHLYGMKPRFTKTTSITTSSNSEINVTPGTLDAWPNKGTVMIKGIKTASGFSSIHQIYHRFTFTGKTNSKLTGVIHQANFAVPVSNEYDQLRIVKTSNGHQSISGDDIWLHQVQPHPFSFIESKVAGNKVRLKDVRGIANGSTNRWVRFAPVWSDTDYTNTGGGVMIDQPYKVIASNAGAREITLDRNLHSSIKTGMACIMQPYIDQTGNFFPSNVSTHRLNFYNTACWMTYSSENSADKFQTINTTTTAELYIWDPMQAIIASLSDEQQQLRIPPVGRMIAPSTASGKGIVFEYNGIEGPFVNFVSTNGVAGYRPGIFKLLNVRIVADLSNDETEVQLGPRTFLVPYQDMDITPISVVSFELTDGDIGFDFEGGTSKYLGWSLPLADQIFATNELATITTNVDMVTIPSVTNYESQHYPSWPQAALRSQPPVFINQPSIDEPNSPGDSNLAGGAGGGCIHYNTNVELWNSQKYISTFIKDVKIGDMIRTPSGPKEVVDRVESRYGFTRIITTSEGKSVHCTHTHPIGTVDNTGDVLWKMAICVEQGDLIMTDEGPQIVDANIRLNFTGQTIHPFYDLHIKDVHQFYANGILVHNKTTQIILS